MGLWTTPQEEVGLEWEPAFSESRGLSMVVDLAVGAIDYL